MCANVLLADGVVATSCLLVGTEIEAHAVVSDEDTRAVRANYPNSRNTLSVYG